MSVVAGKKTLFAFDCDATLVETSLMSIAKLLLNDDSLQGLAELKGYFSNNWMTAWLDVCNMLYKYLHSRGVRKEDFEAISHKVTWVPGMHDLLLALAAEPSVDVILVTDNNRFWIDCLLNSLDVRNCFADVFCASSDWDENGCLIVSGYAPPTGCPYSTNSICKGAVVTEYAKEKGCYGRICYVGDGDNDFCPGLKLRGRDTLYVRKEYSLEKMVQKDEGKFACSVKYWKSGEEILADFHESLGCV